MFVVVIQFFIYLLVLLPFCSPSPPLLSNTKVTLSYHYVNAKLLPKTPSIQLLPKTPSIQLLPKTPSIQLLPKSPSIQLLP